MSQIKVLRLNILDMWLRVQHLYHWTISLYACVNILSHPSFSFENIIFLIQWWFYVWKFFIAQETYGVIFLTFLTSQLKILRCYVWFSLLLQNEVKVNKATSYTHAFCECQISFNPRFLSKGYNKRISNHSKTIIWDVIHLIIPCDDIYEFVRTMFLCTSWHA